MDLCAKSLRIAVKVGICLLAAGIVTSDSPVVDVGTCLCCCLTGKVPVLHREITQVSEVALKAML